MKQTNRNVSFTPHIDSLKNECAIVDNELEKSLADLGLFSRVHLFGLAKTKGFPLKHLMFSLLIWPLLSEHYFASFFLRQQTVRILQR